MTIYHTMEFTGFDSVIFTYADIAKASQKVWECFRSQWPELITDYCCDDKLFEESDAGKLFVSAFPPVKHLVLVFCRNREMLQHLRQRGYTLTGAGDGPVAFHFRIREKLFLQIERVQEYVTPTEKDRGIDPYPACLSSPSILEVTAVTPMNPTDDRFSEWACRQGILACQE